MPLHSSRWPPPLSALAPANSSSWACCPTAADLGVSIDIAGLLITGYAMGVVIGAPIMAIITNRLPRKTTLIGLASTFVIGNLLCARWRPATPR